MFDTCLVRTYLDPGDLVYDLAERVLADRPGRPATAEEVAELAFHRLSAHRRLLGRGDRDEARLSDVYEAMGDLGRWGVDPEGMHREELALERASCRPVACVAAMVARARADGSRVLFLSDMWLPEAFVRGLLLDAGIAREADVVRVSSEDGRSKWTGRLFEAVMAEEGLAPGDLHHRGDDPRTDYAVPRSLGIAATLVDAARPSRYERLALRADGPRHVRSRLAGASRSVRLAYDDRPGTPEAAATAVAAGVAGPLLTAFVAWVMETARRDGVQSLRFLARDGQVMLRAAVALRPPDDDMHLGYLQASRRALLVAGLTDTGPQALEEVLPPPAARSPRRALAALGVTVDDVAAAAAGCGLPSGCWDRPVAGQAAAALAALLGTPEVQERLAVTVAEARAGALAYLEQEGLLGTDDWALVDVGWNLRLQRVLRDLTGRTDRRTLGYYLGARPGGTALSRPGPYRAFLHQGYHEPGPSSPGALVFAHHTVVEALLVPGDSGAVEGYRRVDAGVQPVLGPGLRGSRRRYVDRLHEAVTRYAAELAAAGVLPGAQAEARDHGLAATALFLATPDRAELEGLRELRHADDAFEAVDQPVVAPVTPGRAVRAVVGRTRSQPPSRLMWKAGSIALSGPAIRRAIAMLDRPAGPRRRLLRAHIDRARRRS